MPIIYGNLNFKFNKKLKLFFNLSCGYKKLYIYIKHRVFIFNFKDLCYVMLCFKQITRIKMNYYYTL